MITGHVKPIAYINLCFTIFSACWHLFSMASCLNCRKPVSRRTTSATHRNWRELWITMTSGNSAIYFLRLCGSLYLPSNSMWWTVCRLQLMWFNSLWFLCVEPRVVCIVSWIIYNCWCWCWLLLLVFFFSIGKLNIK